MGISENKNEKLNLYLFGDSEDFKSFLNEENNNPIHIEQNETKKSTEKEISKQYNFKNTNNYHWIDNFSGNEIGEETFNSLIEDIKNNIQDKQEYNCILIFLDNNNSLNKFDINYNCLANIKKVYKPIVILALNNKIKNEKIISNKIKYFKIAFYTKGNYTEIFKQIEEVYNYYFNIGDDGFIQILNELNIFTQKTKKNENEEIIPKYNATINILVIGKAGCGKSTLINLLLDEKRAREGVGYSTTKFYSHYVHKKYPITFTDTMGLNYSKSLDKMNNFINNTKIFFNKGKNKFHLVLYLINAGNERTFMKKELDLINDIRNKLDLPIIFVCTHSKTEEDSQEFKEEVKISLSQYLESKAKQEKSELNEILEEEKKLANQNKEKKTNSNNENETEENLKINSTVNETGKTNKNSEGKSKQTKTIKEELMTKVNKIEEEKSKLINGIYCCHLVDEKDGKYKKFGIEKILRGIKNLFTNEINEIQKIGDDFTSKTNKEGIPNNPITENKVKKSTFNILRSLENSKSFKEYLKKLSVNICENYKNKIYEIIEENKPDIDTKIKELKEVLKNHLAFELNWKPSDFNVDENNVETEQYFWSKYIFQNSKKTDELNSSFKKIEEKIENKMKNDINDIDTTYNMNEVIKSYKNAIDSFEKIIEDINKNPQQNIKSLHLKNN